MAATRAELVARFGIFAPFMKAYGRADAGTRAQLAHATQAYAIGYITPQTYSARVIGLLGGNRL